MLHEGQTRGQIKAQMNTFLKVAGIRDGDLLTQSDVYQIPLSYSQAECSFSYDKNYFVFVIKILKCLNR